MTYGKIVPIKIDRVDQVQLRKWLEREVTCTKYRHLSGGERSQYLAHVTSNIRSNAKGGECNSQIHIPYS
jgi:hypothetical protein